MSPEMSIKDDQLDPRFRDALNRFDRENAEDPNHELVDGVFLPKELSYAYRMTAWLDRLEPKAAEALRLAARCQHIRRWTTKRSEFPASRAGYRQWRTTLAAYHAKTAGDILHEVGYDAQMIARVAALLRKEDLKTDPDVQTLEDVACLVFIEYYLSSFAVQHEEGKLVNILRKTWRKMSDRGRDAAFGINLSPDVRELVKKAIA